ncbi:carotenoid oxygenase family protein [Pseudonocardia sp. CA-107938]|uniref:carotenoid oxygenase family protein n=1 Tax=Pseudonocardia sp. CA-107938 TaxID=3240021 RepID=UPI003D94AC39
MTTTELPAHLRGHLAPVPDEITATDLPVEGAIPAELTGRYFRNGPNPLPGEVTPHWFVGHGMLHGIRLREGRAEWYRNRWVRTKALAGKQMVNPETGAIDYSVGVANTHVVPHAGRIMALVESSFPHLVTPELDTIGTCDFEGRLTTAMTAHPKIDPVTGDLHFFGYGFAPPFVTYHRVDAQGQLVTSAEIEVPGPTMMHDFAITDRHAVFLDLPITFRMELAGRRGMPFSWDEGYGARIGVMPLATPGRVTWFDVDPCYVFHVGNAHTDAQGRVVLDGARYAPADVVAMWEGDDGPTDAAGPAAGAAATGAARLHRWVLDPATGSVFESVLDERPVEFPTVDDDRVGREARYRYAVSQTPGRSAIVKFDADHGSVAVHDLGTDTIGGEAVFVPSSAPGRAEDDGWLLTITTRRDASASQLLVLDATDVGGAPVAAVTLPRGVPAGFHGSWIDDAELGEQ